MISKIIKNRKVFIYKNNEIKGAGILFYKDNKLLLIKNLDRKILYEDFGGKVEMSDNYVYETAAREAVEESNNYFKYDKLISKLKNRKFIYIKHSKYAIYLVKLNKYINPSVVGNYEKTYKINRTIEWININELNKIKLLYRLRHKYLLKIIQKLYIKK